MGPGWKKLLSFHRYIFPTCKLQIFGRKYYFKQSAHILHLILDILMVHLILDLKLCNNQIFIVYLVCSLKWEDIISSFWPVLLRLKRAFCRLWLKESSYPWLRGTSLLLKKADFKINSLTHCSMFGSIHHGRYCMVF